MRRHRVRRRCGQWAIERDGHRGFRISSWHARENSPAFLLSWNGQRKSIHPGRRIRNTLNLLERWGSATCWLAIAYLCCEADPSSGPAFAAAILDAGRGDDIPALIACDWLEEIGARGITRLEGHPGPLDDWALVDAGPDCGKSEGPLASWCRDLMESRCVGCSRPRNSEHRELSERCALCNNGMPYEALDIWIPRAIGADNRGRKNWWN